VNLYVISRNKVIGIEDTPQFMFNE